MRESEYQARLIKKLHAMFPDCTILKNDSGHLQGVPDLSILWNDKWAMLEVKISEDANVQPNQTYHVDRFNKMSYAAFIYPENEDLVLAELQDTFYN